MVGSAAVLLSAGLAAALVYAPQAPAGVPAPPPAVASAYHVNPAHTGYSPTPIAPPLRRRWFRDLDGNVSYPLIADGKVFVTVDEPPSGDAVFMALRVGNGATVWSRTFRSPVVGAALEGETVYLLTSDGMLRALWGDTGRGRWSASLYRDDGAWSFRTPPTASRGRVFVTASGYGGHLFGVNGRTGRVLWRTGVRGSDSSPSTAGGKVFVAYAGPQIYGINARYGSKAWHVGAFPHGGGSYTTTAYRGRVYAPGMSGLVVDATSGRLVDSYFSSAQPAVHGNVLLLLEDGILHGLHRDDHAHRWVFAGDDGTELVSSPLIVNGRGYVASEGGTVYALSLTSGRVLWRADTGSTVYPARDDLNATPIPGMAAGGGLLVVPAKHRLVAYAD